jgi:23S rRNA (pseudouridine1915-N3)-methyltransferase
MTVYVVAVGRMRNTCLRDACEAFIERIHRFLRLEIKEIREASRREEEAALARRAEGLSLLDAIPGTARIVALTRTGRALDSEQFAAQLETWRREARDVALVLGGTYGLDGSVLKRAVDRISLSSLTLPHELARLVLLEQLYRACTILSGHPYHKQSVR